MYSNEVKTEKAARAKRFKKLPLLRKTLEHLFKQCMHDVKLHRRDYVFASLRTYLHLHSVRTHPDHALYT